MKSSRSSSTSNTPPHPPTANRLSLLLPTLLYLKTVSAKGDSGNYQIINNTAGQKTEEISDDSVTALLLFLGGVFILSFTLFCVIRWFLKAEGRETSSAKSSVNKSSSSRDKK